MTGIRNYVIQEYGKPYWNKYKNQILERANLAGNLDGNNKPVAVNSRMRRKEKRANEICDNIGNVAALYANNTIKDTLIALFVEYPKISLIRIANCAEFNYNTVRGRHSEFIRGLIG